MRRRGHDRVGQWVAVDVAGRQADRLGGVLVGRDALRVRHWRVIHRRDGDRHRRDVRVQRAVIRLIREAVRPVVVRRRREGEAAVRVQRYRAVPRADDDQRRQRIAIDIAIVRQHARRRDRQHRVFRRRVAVVGGHRGSLTAVTVMLTVAALESTVPSFALNVKLSGPL